MKHHRHIEFVDVYSSQEPDHPTQVEVITRSDDHSSERTDKRTSEAYVVTSPDAGVSNGLSLVFHEGCDPREGLNGFLTEDLVAILHHRFGRYASGPFNSPENEQIVVKLEGIMGLMLKRRRERQDRGVSGTQIV